MKKGLLIYITLILVQVHAMCPVDTTGESVCTISDYGRKSLQTLPNENLMKIESERNPSFSVPDLTPLNININSKNNQFQYDSSCQFGVCLQDLNNSNNKNQ